MLARRTVSIPSHGQVEEPVQVLFGVGRDPQQIELFNYLPDPGLSFQQEKAGETMPGIVVRSYVIRHGASVVRYQHIAGSFQP
jgi:hypothetical protein